MHAIACSLALLALSGEIRDGTVLVLENSNPLVEAYTRSEITHVALVLNSAGRPWVYEAAPREVRRLTLEAYYGELADFNRRRREKNWLRVRLYQPRHPYSPEERAALRSFLESQVGRRYSVKGYVRQKPGDGIHCAELVSTALGQTGRHLLEPPYAISPSALVARIGSSYEPPLDVALPAAEPAGSWCDRSWNWWAGFLAWCSWASWETLTFCR